MGASSIFGNGTEREGRWVPEPTKRGTFGLVSSYVITLSLCVWSCVHLNLPEHHGQRKQMWRKVCWVVVGSLVPEIVVFTAWYQRHEAKELLKLMMEQCGQQHPESLFHRLGKWLARSIYRKKTRSSSREPSSESAHEMASTHSGSGMTWTLTHGFYAAMGGFAIDGSKTERPFLPKVHENLKFTKTGIKILIRYGYIDEFGDISVDGIRDKGKSSSIAKVLVAIQTLWFCTQLVARLAQYLPISLLELNTFAHGICTIFAIYFWWDKPQDIEQPTLLPLDRIQPLCAFFWMHSKLSESRLTYNQEPRAFLQSKYLTEARFWTSVKKGGDKSPGQPVGGKHSMAVSGLVFDANDDSSSDVGNLPSNPGPHMSGQVAAEQKMPHLPSSPSLRPQDPKLSPETADENHDISFSPELVIKKGCVVPGTIFTLKATPWVPESASLGQIDITRLSLASKVEEIHPGLMSQSDKLVREEKNFLAPRVPDLSIRSSLFAVVVVFTTAMVYGGLHCLAWSSQSFATGTERLLWRISCLALIIPIPLTIFGQSFFFILSSLFSRVKKFLPSAPVSTERSLSWAEGQLLTLISFGEFLRGWFQLCILLALFLLFVFAVLGRAYLVIECFINVGHLEGRVFLLPSWTNYLPHIG